MEKLHKETAALVAGSGKDDDARSKISKPRHLCQACSHRAKQLLDELWIPPYCKLRSLRSQPNGKYSIEGSKCLTSFKTLRLSVPKDYANLSKGKASTSDEALRPYRHRDRISIVAVSRLLNSIHGCVTVQLRYGTVTLRYGCVTVQLRYGRGTVAVRSQSQYFHCNVLLLDC